MSDRVVCISRTVGAGGEQIGRGIAHQLGFRYVDEEIVAKAAEKARMDLGTITAAEHRQPLVRRLLDAIGLPHGMPDMLSYLRPADTEYRYHLTSPVAAGETDDPRAFIRAAIKDIAGEGRVVIVAHAASLALAGRAGVLRVLITASPQTRAERLSVRLLKQDADAAVRESDQQRREYIRRFYDIAEELPTHYDVVLNTDVLSPAQAVAIVVAAAGT